MNTKSTGLVAFILAASVAALLHAAPPQDDPSLPAADRAKRTARIEIFAKVNTVTGGGFSRAGPRSSHSLQFEQELLVDGEKRLPFAISAVGAEKPELKGYVRLSDQEIFLLDPKTGKHQPASQHPRFAPPPLLQVEPVKRV
jgi:hypothetical protein